METNNSEVIVRFRQMMKEVYPLADKDVDLFMSNTEEVICPGGTLLIETGKVECYTYFVGKGLARGFFYQDGKDITIWFASEGMALLSMNAYLYEKSGYENIELLEDCNLLKIANSQLNVLFEENAGLANWGRRMSDTALLKLERIFMERNFMSASQRYYSLIANEPGILRKVSLRHIASYLGISQVSLSRIRAGLQ